MLIGQAHLVGPSMGSGRAANRKARPDTIALTAGRGSHRGDHGDAIRDVVITLNADRAVRMSIGQPVDRRESARVRTEDSSSGKRERFAACPELVEGQTLKACTTTEKAIMPP